MSRPPDVRDAAPTPPQWQAPPPHSGGPSGAGGVGQVVVTALLVALAFGAGWFGNAFTAGRDQVVSNDPNLQSIVQAYRAVSDQYVYPSAVNQQKMAYAAIGAMVDSLGDTGHSRFETPQEVQQENDSLQNKPTVGIGVLLSGGGSQPLRIDEVFPSSAADGKLKPGDLIVGVGGKNIKGMTIDQVRPLIEGDAGTPVTLSIQRHGVAKPFDVTLVRKPFTVPLVTTYIIPGVNLADIQVAEFDESNTDSTAQELKKALQRPDVQAARGIILDLRENPGGFLDQAVTVSSQFFPAGKGHTVYLDVTRSGNSAIKTPVPGESGGLATTTPLVIIINGNTASAAEITTAAIMYNADTLNDRPYVQVVGANTFGTDTILTPVPLADGGEVLLGTQGWQTPSGQNVHPGGITPTQAVALPDGATEVTPLVAQEEQLTEAQILAGSDAQLQLAIKDLTH